MSPQNEETQPLDGSSACSEEIEAFRQKIKGIREQNRTGWEATRKLVSSAQLPETLSRLASHIRTSSYSLPFQEWLLQCCQPEKVATNRHELSHQLKTLTGYPTTKALRALCLFLGVHEATPVEPGSPEITPSFLEDLLRQSPNPYEVLRHVTVPSLLDIGAGDLSFEEELVIACEPWLRQSEKTLILHAMDRLQPGSQLGGRYHAQTDRLTNMKSFLPNRLQFKFWGGVNMANLSTLKEILPLYTMVTCHAPATPTFAYEPTRLSSATIRLALTKTKGLFREVPWGKEKALEVEQAGQVFNFPAWKFEILGPLALLNLIAHRGQLCVLSAIDSEVFWELLAQLLDNEQYRPQNVLFEPETIAEVFGTLYSELIHLPIGASVQLAQLANLRKQIPCLSTRNSMRPALRFRSIEIRRGAVLEGIPSSFTARQFPHMSEELTPWWLILIPE
ncbi:MAG: hypothetical protein GKS05_00895 [Nitrospirales bacterium]|nr:hypothetical protein [Nitrospirales bacterium]